MKLVVAYVKPQMLNDVIFALHEIEGLPGASVGAGQGFGAWRMNEPPAAVECEPSNFHPHQRIEIVCDDALVRTVVERIHSSARTGSATDGIVFVQAVESVFSIRTGNTV